MDAKGDDATSRRRINAFLFCFLHAGIFFGWYALPLANTIFFHGYAQLGSADTFVSARYGWDWVHIFLLTLNQLLPASLAWALANADVEEWTRFHRWLSQSAVRVNLWVFLVLTVRWLLFCNTPFSDGSTACNDYRWCCVFWPSDWCPNYSACGTAFDFLDLSRNMEHVVNWAFSLVFALLAVWNVQINLDLRAFGVLQ